MTAGRTSVSSGSPYEPRFGFSRAVKTGRVIAIAGTAPLDADGRTTGTGDVEVQARRCFQIIESALKQLGASLSDITRTRVLLTRVEDWQKVAAVHGEFFGGIRPACTVMQVSRFVDPEWLIEIEADAVLDAEGA